MSKLTFVKIQGDFFFSPPLFSSEKKCQGATQSCCSMKSFISNSLAFYHFGTEQGEAVKKITLYPEDFSIIPICLCKKNLNMKGAMFAIRCYSSNISQLLDLKIYLICFQREKFAGNFHQNQNKFSQNCTKTSRKTNYNPISSSHPSN